MNLSFLQLTQNNSIVYLGAGDFDVTSIEVNENTKIHLVDANEQLVKKLKKQYQNNKNIQVYLAVVSNKAELINYKFYSLSEFNGIATPTGLKTLYPGLKELDSKSKNTVAINDYIAGLTLNTKEQHGLFIDIPGLSAVIVQALLQSQQLQLFAQLTIKMPHQPLFEEELSLNDVINLLQTNGFICQQTPSKDPDFVELQAQLNPLFKELTTAKNTITEQQNQLNTVTEQNSHLSTEQKKLQSQLQAETQQNQNANQELTTQLTQSKIKLQDAQAELKNYQAWLKEVQDEAEQLKTELAEFVQAKFALENAQTENEKLTTEINQITDLLDQQNKQLKTQEQETKKYQAWLKDSESNAKQKAEVFEVKITEQQANIEEANQQIEQLKTEKQQNSQKIIELLSQIEKTKQDLETVRKELDDTKAERETKIEQLNICEEKIAEKQSYFMKRKEQVLRLEQQLDAANLVIEESEVNNRRLHSQQSFLIKQDETINSLIESLRSELTLVTQENHQKQLQNRLLEKELIRLESQLNFFELKILGWNNE